VPATQTAHECLEVLGKYRAKRAGLAYGADKVPMGITFVLDTRWGERGYEVAVNFEGTGESLERAYKDQQIERKYTGHAHAQKVAWRVLKMWLESNLALVEAGLAEAERVLLPYVLLSPDRTLFDEYDRQQSAIGTGERNG
jgi:transcriptional regulator CtsR